MSYRDQENQALLRRGVEAVEKITRILSGEERSKLVYCSECVDYLPEDGITVGPGSVMMCTRNGNWPEPTDFCSRGTRRSSCIKH